MPKILDSKVHEEIIRQYEAQIPKATITRNLKVSPSTVRNVIFKKFGNKLYTKGPYKVGSEQEAIQQRARAAWVNPILHTKGPYRGQPNIGAMAELHGVPRYTIVNTKPRIQEEPVNTQAIETPVLKNPNPETLITIQEGLEILQVRQEPKRIPKPGVMYNFLEAPEVVRGWLLGFREKINDGHYQISAHARRRMIKRGVDLPEIFKVIETGELRTCGKRDGQIGGTFYTPNLAVIVCSEYGRFDAPAVIVTVFNPSSPDEYLEFEDDLILPAPIPNGQDITRMTEVEIFTYLKGKGMKASLQDYTAEELLAAYQQKRTEENAEKLKTLNGKRFSIAARVKSDLRDIALIEEEITSLGGELQDL